MASRKKNSIKQKSSEHNEQQYVISKKQSTSNSGVNSRAITNLFIAAPTLMVTTYSLYQLISDPIRFHELVNLISQTNKFLLFSFVLTVVAAFMALIQVVNYSRFRRDQATFQEIDKERKKNELLQHGLSKDSILHSYKLELSSALNKKCSSLEKKISSCETQQALFIKTTNSLTEQVKVFDEKASLMLDKGISIAKLGVLFLVISIIVWQGFFFFFAKEVDPRHYIGMASCSVIFIFMQALAGWCLKQHRAYIDASLYVIKLRSIFKKKMQAYLLLQEYSEDKSGYQKVLSNFLEDISWPPEPLSAKQQASYIKEAAATISEVTSAMRTVHPTPQKPTRRNRSHLL